MTEMKDIEALAKDYAASRERLSAHVKKMETEIAAVRARGMRRLKNLSEQAVTDRVFLKAEIALNPDLFKRPRTRLLHGIKFGFAKGKGKLSFALAPDMVVRLIRKHLPEQADVLVKVTEAPVKTAMGQLTAAELKRIGAKLEGTGDEVIVKPADNEIDKIVDALIALGDDAEVRTKTGGKAS